VVWVQRLAKNNRAWTTNPIHEVWTHQRGVGPVVGHCLGKFSRGPLQGPIVGPWGVAPWRSNTKSSILSVGCYTTSPWPSPIGSSFSQRFLLLTDPLESKQNIKVISKINLWILKLCITSKINQSDLLQNTGQIFCPAVLEPNSSWIKGLEKQIFNAILHQQTST